MPTPVEELIARFQEEYGDRWAVELLRYAIGGTDLALHRRHSPGLLEWLEQMVVAGVKASETLA
jgi:hypothetical protein